MTTTTHGRFEAMRDNDARISALNTELRDLGKAQEKARRAYSEHCYAGAYENYLNITAHIARAVAEIKTLRARKF